MVMTPSERVKKSQAKCDAIMLRPPLERGKEIRQAAADAGESVSGYILKAVAERMEKEKARE
jgi:uncharacterized protein (DUF1778 family)